MGPGASFRAQLDSRGRGQDELVIARLRPTGGLAKPPQLLSAASGKSEEWTLRRDRTYEIRTYEDAVRVIEQYGS